MRMSWEHLAFLHWQVPVELLASQLPDGLRLDTFNGAAWLGIVPFFMSDARARGCPGFPTAAQFLELNLRTYVTRGGRPGVWFFSLDANSWLAVRGARTGFHLPYFDARMGASVLEDVAFCSRRTHRDATPGSFRARYQPDGNHIRSKIGPLEHWLTERYCLYSADRRGNLYRGEVHHEPWPLQSAKVKLLENSLGDLIGADLSAPPTSVLYARRLDVVAWRILAC